MNKQYTRTFYESALPLDFSSFCHRAFDVLNPGTTFKPNWHIDAMAHHLEQCASGKIRRLIITVPPRNLKSHCASVVFPAWLLGQDPTARIVCASYSNDLSTKLSRDRRALMTSSFYKRIFSATRIDPKKNTELEFTTTKRGYRLSTSVEGTLTGRGGNVLIVDDPLKPQEALSDAKRKAVNAWWDNTLYSRLDDKQTGTIIVIMQRLHIDDLVGHIKEKEEWVHLNLPAIAPEEVTIPIYPGRVHKRVCGDVLHPEHEPLKVLSRMKETLGTYSYSAQYQQEPVQPGGGLIKWEWFQVYDERPYHYDSWIAQSWDTASKSNEFNDYSVCTTWAVVERNYYLLDVFRKRLDFPSLRKAVITQAREGRARSIVIEDMGSGIGLIQDLRSGRPAGMPMPQPFKPEGDKVMRMGNQTAKIEAGKVHLPRNAPWLKEFREEIMAFPQGRHDDQVDSMSQFLTWMEKRNTVTVMALPGR